MCYHQHSTWLCLRAALRVFAYSALKSHIQFICMFPFWFGGAFPLADRRASGLFFRTCTWGHQLYWKVSVSFSHTSSHRGIRYLSEVGANNVLPLPPPPFLSSLQVQSSPLPPFFFTTVTHELMIFRSLAFGSVEPCWEGRCLPAPLFQLSVHFSLKCLKSKAHREKLVKII